MANLKDFGKVLGNVIQIGKKQKFNPEKFLSQFCQMMNLEYAIFEHHVKKELPKTVAADLNRLEQTLLLLINLALRKASHLKKIRIICGKKDIKKLPHLALEVFYSEHPDDLL